ncbi:MAG TPA: carbamate kinase [Candidatus Bathyarchaeota archaeon]|nr:carbamate kinase [Candidatus Bathyarchaeota archaeon]
MERNEKYILLALGGNAFQTKGEKGTTENYWKNAYSAAETIVKIVKEGYKVAITHGNGPQVGTILEWMERSKDKIPPLAMDIAGAMTQGWLGYLLMQSIHNTLIKEGIKDHVKGAVAIVNQVLVSKEDPAWQNPTKYVGSYYTEEEAKKIAAEKGWVIKPDPRGGYRRVVPSPNPTENIEVGAVKKLIDEGWIVIASGGGGIPVIRNEDGTLQGVEAVIDKDLAGEVLATSLGVGTFVILTDVDGIYINFKQPNEKKLDVVKVSELEKYYEEGHFKPGSMGPKVLAAMRFIKHGGKRAMIGHLKNGYEVIKGNSGTMIIPD